MKGRLNRFIKAATLCLNPDHLIMILADGRCFEGKELSDLPDLDQQPILLVINPTQFLTAHGGLQHLYLTTWQQEVLHQLRDLPYVLRSVLFLPDLIEERRGMEQSALVNSRDQQYLYISKESVVFWTHLKDDHNQAQQLQEIGLYLRRYQVESDMNEVNKNLVSHTLTDSELQIKAGQRATFNLQNNNFHFIQEMVEKQRKSRTYMVLVSGLLSLIGGGMIVGSCLLLLSVQAFVNHNPYNLSSPAESLEEVERKKLLQFKSFLLFQSRYPAFSFFGLQGLFRKFAGKIVATDMVWQEGKWTIAFVIDPACAAELPQINKWCEENLKASKLIESETTAHQYTLQFE